ncbi:HK97 family phage prohead protease [Mycolicibacterium sp. CR10]|uniref:HK97 family phage prohead protease n=1 Tax=Mycolicibacterium sp. CR10 TaxID=2562314 RepID=UPI00197B95CF|nr:HK97 family phage prohead protease [Mycolicibacterium sp. CR10]
MADILTRSAEFRSEVKGNTLTGYASVYGTYADLGSYVETFAPTAFDATLADSATDVRSFWNHDSAMLLGRQTAGTLRVWSDSTGLGFEVKLPKTSAGNDVRELAERGDIGGVSIGFRADSEQWSTIGNRDLRTHTSVASLIEVSPVSIPAYGSTTVHLRSLADISTHPAIDSRTQILAARTRAHRKVQN